MSSYLKLAQRLPTILWAFGIFPRVARGKSGFWSSKAV